MGIKCYFVSCLPPGWQQEGNVACSVPYSTASRAANRRRSGVPVQNCTPLAAQQLIGLGFLLFPYPLINWIFISGLAGSRIVIRRDFFLRDKCELGICYCAMDVKGPIALNISSNPTSHGTDGAIFQLGTRITKHNLPRVSKSLTFTCEEITGPAEVHSLLSS